MEAIKEASNLSLILNREEALVLFEWLSRFNKEKYSALFQDQAKERVLWDLEAILEESMDEAFATNYQELLLEARRALRDKE